MAKSQLSTVSPYSRYGLGEPQTVAFVQGWGMGHLTSSLRDPLNINYNNPASANSLRLTTLEMMGRTDFITQSSTGQTPVEQATSVFNYFALGIPVSEKYGLSFGFLPYTAVGYLNSEIINNQDIGDVYYFYSAKGGLNKAFLNQSYQLFKGLSLGIQLSYYFGSTDYEQNIRFDDPSLLGTKYLRNYLVSDINATYGIQYSYSFSELREFTAGAHFEQNNSLRSTYTESAYTLGTGRVLEIPRDTLVKINADGDFLLPNQFTVGGMYGVKHPDLKQYAWMAGADFRFGDWTNFSDFNGVSQGLTNSFGVSVGGEIHPKYAFSRLNRTRNFAANIRYRFGVYYDSSPVELRGQRITQSGITFGVGVPLRIKGLAPGEERSNIINLGLNYGARGTLNDGLIREEILQVIFWVTLNDRWFIKYKYR